MAPTSTIDSKHKRAARQRDREIAPLWDQRFVRAIARSLPDVEAPFILDVRPRTGHTTQALLECYGEGTRILAVEEDAAMIERAKARVPADRKSAVYFKPGNFDEVLEMARDTYDIVVANLVLGETVPDWKDGLAELMRLAKPGGEVLATVALRGTFGEVEDLFSDVLRMEGLAGAAKGLSRIRRLRPQMPDIVAGLTAAGLARDQFVVHGERYRLVFASGRELLFSPVIEQGPLRLWQALLKNTPDPAKTFWRFRGAIDTYYDGLAVSLKVLVGMIHVRVPGAGAPLRPEREALFPSLARVFNGDFSSPGTPPMAESGPINSFAPDNDDDDDDDDDDLDLDIDLDFDDDEDA